jgi:anti-anti-sigma factor
MPVVTCCAPDLLTVDVATSAGRSTLFVRGELDLSTVPQLQRELDHAIELSDGAVIVDLAAIDFIDLTGLRCLVAAERQRATRAVTMVNPSRAVRRLDQLCRLVLSTGRPTALQFQRPAPASRCSQTNGAPE